MMLCLLLQASQDWRVQPSSPELMDSSGHRHSLVEGPRVPSAHEQAPSPCCIATSSLLLASAFSYGNNREKYFGGSREIFLQDCPFSWKSTGLLSSPLCSPFQAYGL